MADRRLTHSTEGLLSSLGRPFWFLSGSWCIPHLRLCFRETPVGSSTRHTLHFLRFLQHHRPSQRRICSEQVIGSDNKEVRSQRVFSVAGAQIDSSAATVREGATLCGYPVQKRLALAAASVRVVQCPYLSEELVSCVTGCWISCFLYRRCFMIMSVLDRLFSSGRAEACQP